jgi:uncharacterized metal-binding protein
VSVKVKCTKCGTYGCFSGKADELPEGCPTPESASQEILKEYQQESLKIAKIAAEIEAKGYMKLTRIEELMKFA